MFTANYTATLLTNQAVTKNIFPLGYEQYEIKKQIQNIKWKWKKRNISE